MEGFVATPSVGSPSVERPETANLIQVQETISKLGLSNLELKNIHKTDFFITLHTNFDPDKPSSESNYDFDYVNYTSQADINTVYMKPLNIFSNIHYKDSYGLPVLQRGYAANIMEKLNADVSPDLQDTFFHIVTGYQSAFMHALDEDPTTRKNILDELRCVVETTRDWQRDHPDKPRAGCIESSSSLANIDDPRIVYELVIRPIIRQRILAVDAIVDPRVSAGEKQKFKQALMKFADEVASIFEDEALSIEKFPSDIVFAVDGVVVSRRGLVAEKKAAQKIEIPETILVTNVETFGYYEQLLKNDNLVLIGAEQIESWTADNQAVGTVSGVLKKIIESAVLPKGVGQHVFDEAKKSIKNKEGFYGLSSPLYLSGTGTNQKKAYATVLDADLVFVGHKIQVFFNTQYVAGSTQPPFLIVSEQ
jgi:hypothetical protein